jgi:CubicO group peptidase (beta-lactamase class C family)
MKMQQALLSGMVLAVMICQILLSPGVAAFEMTLVDKIDEIVTAQEKYDLFSGTVLVAQHGKIMYTGTAGFANRDHDVPNRLETRFNIGSIGKTFTSALIMQLVQEEKIALTDPLSRYFPELPYQEKAAIQIGHLLNHSAGLDNYMRHEDYDAKKDELRRIQDVLPLIYDQEPLFKAGEKFSYSNSGMVLLGAVIEKVTGMEYRDYLKLRILDPLGMKNTGIVYTEDVCPGRATGYNNIYRDTYQAETLRQMPAFSDGGLYTTVLDLLKFDQALYGEILLAEKYRDIMFTPVGPNRHYAYGWIVVPFGGTTVIYHGGGSPGFTAEFRRYPEKGYTLIVLSNYYISAFDLTNTLEAVLLGLPYVMPTPFDLNYRRGMYYQEAHQEYKKAIAFFEKNLADPGPHLPSLYQCARSKLLGEFDQEKAVEELDRYIGLADERAEPSIAAAWWRKGVAHEQLGKAADAVKCYQASLAVDSDFEQSKEALERLEASMPAP